MTVATMTADVVAVLGDLSPLVVVLVAAGIALQVGGFALRAVRGTGP